MIRLALLTLVTLMALAANSLLNRQALLSGTIDPLQFAQLRLMAGAVFLLALVWLRQRRWPTTAGSWRGGAWLALYAGSFSLSYLTLPAGAGAFVLFVTVQFTVTVISLRAGERMNARQWGGYTLALIGFVWFVSPTTQGLSLSGLTLMIVAGIAWGLYTLQGRHSRAALADTAMNFAYALIWLLPVLLVWLWLSPSAQSLPGAQGIILAVISGALASGIGYVLWYSLVPRMSGVQSGLIQLTVPILAALASVVLLGEVFTPAAVVASLLVLAGIAVHKLAAR